MVCRRDVVLGSGVVRDAVGQTAPQFLREGSRCSQGIRASGMARGGPGQGSHFPPSLTTAFSSKASGTQAARDLGWSHREVPGPCPPHPKTSSWGSWPSALGLSALDPTSFPGDTNKRRENVVEGRRDGVKEKQEERGPPANTAETSPSLSPLSFRAFVH